MGEKASFMGRDGTGNALNRDEGGDAADLVEIAGAIKWFDVAKGYGFILPDDGSSGDILLHVTCLRKDGFQTALEGARVVCLVEHGAATASPSSGRDRSCWSASGAATKALWQPKFTRMWAPCRSRIRPIPIESGWDSSAFA
jgi:cold shock CspA family protein